MSYSKKHARLRRIVFLKETCNKSHKAPPLVSHWPEPSQMAKPGSSGGWEVALLAEWQHSSEHWV